MAGDAKRRRSQEAEALVEKKTCSGLGLGTAKGDAEVCRVGAGMLLKDSRMTVVLCRWGARGKKEDDDDLVEMVAVNLLGREKWCMDL